jgi:redox-sensitive bicupin YhaK (pirin superfamily)
MIQHIKAQARYHHQTDWLSTYWHFSFDHYWDPANVSFGALRVFNDDVIQPATGFPPHGHRDMEIVTYVLDGELEHQDNRGNRGRVRAGEVQVMSAGTGIVHAERNPLTSDVLHLLQIWILPRTEGLTPRWEQRKFARSQRRGRLLPVVSGDAAADSLRIDQDATIYVAALDAGEAVVHSARRGRRAYAFAIQGRLTLDGLHLNPGDQLRVTDEPTLRVSALEPSELILLDLP